MKNKKILIAGPLPLKNKSGGVAVFTKNIALEFYRKGYRVEVLSNFDGHICSQIKVQNACHILSVIKNFKPDIFISSLIYSILFILCPKNIIKVHLLHGFSNFKNYSSLKLFLMHVFDMIIKKFSNLILSNSEFTRFINNEIFNIKSNGIFHIGLNHNDVRKLNLCSLMNTSKNNVLYVGRLVKAKNIKLICKSFCQINSDKYTLILIGYGNEAHWLRKFIHVNDNVHYLGPKDHKKLIKYYINSKVFISLNPAEPYGITFLEALLSNDFVIAPNTGGQLELLKHFPNRCKFVNINDKNDVTSAIKYGLNKHLKPINKFCDMYYFSYDRTYADLIKNIVLYKGNCL